MNSEWKVDPRRLGLGSAPTARLASQAETNVVSGSSLPKMTLGAASVPRFVQSEVRTLEAAVKRELPIVEKEARAIVNDVEAEAKVLANDVKEEWRKVSRAAGTPSGVVF
jgi:hypothetical protein